MASRESIVNDLLEKLRDAPADLLAEVVDFAEFLRVRRVRQATPATDVIDESEAQAAATGLLRLPDPQARKLSTTEAPPVHVAGKPASEIVREERR